MVEKKTKKIGFGISQKLLLVLLVVALVPMICVAQLSRYDISKLSEDKIYQELESINSTLVTHVNDWVDTNERMLKLNASRDIIRGMLGFKQENALKDIPKIYDWTYLAMTIDNDGNNVARSDDGVLQDYSTSQYYQQVVRGSEFGSELVVGKSTGTSAMIMSTAVKGEDNSIVGVLAIGMTLEQLSNSIVDKKIGKTGFTFLVDAQGNIIAHPDATMTRARVNLNDHKALQAFKQGERTTIFKDSTGKKIVAAVETTNDGWLMVSQQDYDEAFQVLSSVQQKGFIVLGVTIVIVLIIALLITRWITAPIRNLTQVADRYSRGQLDLSISEVERNDEIGQLAQAIDRLGTSIRMAMQRLQKRKTK
jgi:methyl-accepting chemotaxis protein